MRTASIRRRFAETYQGVPACTFGRCFTRCWVVLASMFLANAPAWAGPSSTAVFDLACLIAAVALAAAARRCAPAFANPRIRSLLGSGLAVSTLIFAIAAFAGGSGLLMGCLYCTGAALGGFCFSAASLLWQEYYATFSPMRVVVYYSTERLLGELLSWILAGSAQPQLFVLMFLLGPATSLCLKRCGSYVEGRGIAIATNLTPRIPLKPTVCVSLLIVMFSLARSTLVSVGIDYPQGLLWGIPPLVVIAGVMLRLRAFTTLWINKLVVFTLLAIAVTFPFYQELPPLLFGWLVGVGEFTVNLLCFLVLGQISYRLRISALWLFGITRAFKYGGLVIGAACVDLLESVGASLGFATYPSFAVALLAGTAVLCVVALSENGIFISDWGIGYVVDKDTNEVEPADPLLGIGELYGLTQRESEVLFLLTRHGTATSIASELFVSTGTVKAHIQHIYQKCGVHTRAELLALVCLDGPVDTENSVTGP